MIGYAGLNGKPVAAGPEIHYVSMAQPLNTG